MRKHSGVVAVVVAAVLVLTGQGQAVDIGVVGKKLIIVDKTVAASKAKVVFVSKDKVAGISKGTSEDIDLIDVQFDYSYPAGSAFGSFVIPAGGFPSGGTDGWKVNKGTVAKYVNKPAPSGPTGAKVAVIKPGKLLKIVGKNLGDVPIDIITPGAPLGPVEAVYTVNNAGETFKHCTSFPACTHKVIAGGTGAKLVCKNGIADVGACPPPPTTSSTSSTTTTSTSSTTTTSTSSTTTTSTSSTTTSSTTTSTTIPNLSGTWFLSGTSSGTSCTGLGVPVGGPPAFEFSLTITQVGSSLTATGSYDYTGTVSGSGFQLNTTSCVNCGTRCSTGTDLYDPFLKITGTFPPVGGVISTTQTWTLAPVFGSCGVCTSSWTGTMTQLP